MVDVKEISRLLALPAPLRVLPGLGWRVPGLVARAAPGVLGAALCVLVYRQPALLGIGLTLAALAVVAQLRLVAWALIVYLAGSLLGGDPALEWRFFVLLLGLHLVDVLARVALVAPLRGWVQLAVLRRPLGRLVVVQAVVQPLAAVALWLLAPNADGEKPLTLGFFGLVGAAALVVVTLVLLVPLMRDRVDR